MTKKTKRYTSASPSQWLGLSKDETTIINLKVGLSLAAKERRKEIGWTQQQLADALGTFQSRIAKFERGNPDFSIEFMIRGLLAMGFTLADVQNKMQDISGTPGESQALSLFHDLLLNEEARQETTELLASNPDLRTHWGAVLEDAERLVYIH